MRAVSRNLILATDQKVSLLAMRVRSRNASEPDSKIKRNDKELNFPGLHTPRQI